MIVCGAEISSNFAALALIRSSDDGTFPIECGTKKIFLNDDQNKQSLTNFLATINSLIHDNKIQVIVLKTRQTRGKLAGGGLTFKIETLFQLSNAPVVFAHPTVIARFAKTNAGGIPESILKYQRDAYLCAAWHASKQ